jgi:hypothetical protein
MRRNLLDVLLPMAVYAAILIPSCQYLKAHPGSPWRVPVAVAPVVPIAFVVWASIKRVREMDELAQRKYLEAAAVNWMYVGVCMFLLFGLGQMLAWLRYR